MDVLRRHTPPPPSHRSSSTLNPNAPVFIPMAYYVAVEDFSDKWWSLVQSSPWFRDYWLTECFQDPQSDCDDLDLPDLDFTFDDYHNKQEEEEEERRRLERELVSVSALRWNDNRARGRAEAPRYCDKAPKLVNVKVSPRPIQQPR